MNYQQLGQSNLHISQIGFGCMSLEANQVKTNRLVDLAIERGVNYFDTADIYQSGFNEEMLGKALGSKRNKIILATKVGNQPKSNGPGWDWNPKKEYILSAVERSLKRLGTDYIDLYQLHGGTIEDPIEETIEAFEILKAQGKIRYYGISSIRPNVIREYIKRSSFVSVMMQYSLLDRRPEENCLPLLTEHKIGVLARGVLAGGLLVNKPPKEYLGYTPAELEKLKALIHVQTMDPVSIAIQYVVSAPVVASAVIGIRTEEQLEAAISGVQFEMDDRSRKQLGSVLEAKLYELHR